MSSYTVIAGDTFDLISRKEYGSEDGASSIAQANPGAAEPLTPGTLIVIPARAGAPQDLPSLASADNPSEVAILIDGTRFRFWTGARISKSIDRIPTVEFSGIFNSDSQIFREVFRPFTYQSIDITIGGIPFFKGTAVPILPVVTPDATTVEVGAYGIPGVLSDCYTPASFYSKGQGKLEFNGQTLLEISSSLCDPFGITPVALSDQGAAFGRVAIAPDEKILPFLIKLAAQRNLLITDSNSGELVYDQPTATGSPVARLSEGSAPVISVTPSFNAQEYYSHITGIEPVTAGTSGAQFTVKNTLLPGIVRPYTFKVDDASGGDLKAAVLSKMGRMFGNMAAYTVAVATWRDPQGDLWEPDTTITLIAPGAMIYTEYEFLIRTVDYDTNRKTEVAFLHIVLPGSFTGELPEVLPWDG